jgi:cation:H+ antiporter
MVVQNAPVIGLALGMGPLVTGLTLVAVGTALPEIAVAAMAGLQRTWSNVGRRPGPRDLPVQSALHHWRHGAGASRCRCRPPSSASSYAGGDGLALLLYPLLGGDLKIARREGGWLLLRVRRLAGFRTVCRALR